MWGTQGCAMRAGLSMLALFASAPGALAESYLPLSAESLTATALAATALLLATGFASLAVVRLRRKLQAERARVADLELLLNEAEV